MFAGMLTILSRPRSLGIVGLPMRGISTPELADLLLACALIQTVRLHANTESDPICHRVFVVDATELNGKTNTA